MPARTDEATIGRMVVLRALDWSKQEIAAELDVSRNTVRRHLNDLQEQAGNDRAAQANIVLDNVEAQMRPVTDFVLVPLSELLGE